MCRGTILGARVRVVMSIWRNKQRDINHDVPLPIDDNDDFCLSNYYIVTVCSSSVFSGFAAVVVSF